MPETSTAVIPAALRDLLLDAIRGEQDGTTIPVPVEDCRRLADLLTPVADPDDQRLTAARDRLTWYDSVMKDGVLVDADHEWETTTRDLLAYADERLRVNVGLIHENTALRRRVAELEGR